MSIHLQPTAFLSFGLSIKTHAPYKVQRQTEYNKSNTLSFIATQEQNHQPKPSR